MNFKSGFLNLGSENFRRALAISLVLHAFLLLQKLPAATGQFPQAGSSRQALYLSASLRSDNALAAPVSTLPADFSRKPKALSQKNAPIPVTRQSNLPHPPQPVLEVAAPEKGELDANGLRQYRLGLAKVAREYKLYPAQALANGWSGTAEVSLVVAADGVSQPVRLLHSSGHDLLDAAAIEMVANAARRTTLPDSLRGQSFSVPLPVVFDVDGK